MTQYLSGLGIGLALVGTTAKADEEGRLYTMDNAAGANHVLAFQQEENGSITSAGTYATGGAGAGAGLSSQGSISLSHDGRWLFVCNAGSSEVSVFAASRDGLVLTDKVASGGQMPVSLAISHHLLYVVNAGGSAGGSDNITAFTFDNGKLTTLAGSTQPLSAANTGPAQVSFAQDGEVILVTERLTNLIDTYALRNDGVAREHHTFQSVGTTPFGFDVGSDRMFVSEAGTGSASSYKVSDDGELAVISGAVSTEQNAPCWLILSRDARFAYTANAGSGSISGFRVGHEGSLHLLDADGRTGVIGTGTHPVDMVVSRDGRFLNCLANGNGTINAFGIGEDGSLQPLAVASGIATSAAGLAGR